MPLIAPDHFKVMSKHQTFTSAIGMMSPDISARTLGQGRYLGIHVCVWRGFGERKVARPNLDAKPQDAPNACLEIHVHAPLRINK